MGRTKGRRLQRERRVMTKAKNDEILEDTDTQVSDEDTLVSDIETKDVSFFNPHDGLKGRDGGPYLDFVEREQQEKIRANKENREPVTGGEIPAVAGTPLVTAAQIVDNSTHSNPSRANAPGLTNILNDDDLDSEDYFVDPVSTLPISTGTEEPPEKLDPSVDGSKSASPGAEAMRGEGPDEDDNPNPGSVGSEPGNTVETS